MHDQKLPRLFMIVESVVNGKHHRESKKPAEFSPAEAEEVKNGKWLYRMIRAYRIFKKKSSGVYKNTTTPDYRRAMQTLGDMSEEIAARLDDHIPQWRSKI